MDQCAQIDVLIAQDIVRRIEGRLRWVNGLSIMREPEETWVDAINRRVQKEQTTRDAKQSVYLVEIEREDSDTDTDEQEELGWRVSAATVNNLQSYGTERTTRVSRGYRKEVPSYTPNKAHREKEFTPRRKGYETNQEKNTVLKNTDSHRHQDRLQRTATPIPIDISPEIFEGKLDSELVPMEVNRPAAKKVVKDRREAATHDTEGFVRDVPQVWAKKGKAQLEVVRGLLETPLTLSLCKIACILPSMRRDLVGTLRAIRDEEEEGNDAGRKDEGGRSLKDKKVLKVEEMPKETGEVYLGSMLDPGNVRRDLIKIDVTIGSVTMRGVVDTRSMINMISEEMVEEMGLLPVPLKNQSLTVRGMNGSASQCRAYVPCAAIGITPAKMVTYGELYVLENADFNLLLGRPWETLNNIFIRNEDHESYVGWPSKNGRWWVNAGKKGAMPFQLEGRRYPQTMKEADDDDEGQREVSYAAKVVVEPETDQSCVLNSEGIQNALDDEEHPESPEEDKEAVQAQLWAQERVAEWKRRWEAGEGTNSEEEGYARKEVSPPPNQLDKGKGRAKEGEEEHEEARHRKRTRERTK